MSFAWHTGSNNIFIDLWFNESKKMWQQFGWSKNCIEF